METSGGGEDDQVIRYVSHYINTLGAQCIGGIGSPMAGFRTFPNEEILFARAKELGKELCQSIQAKRHFPEQDEPRSNFKARMKRLIEFRQKEWAYEWEYWQANLR